MLNSKKLNLKKTLLATLLVSSLALVGCNDDDYKVDKSVQQPPAQPALEHYVSQTPYQSAVPDYAKSIDVMTYNMPSVSGQMTKATAMVMMPKTAKPADGWRVVVWAHGTVGAGDVCAPSKNAIGERFGVLAKSLLEQGYVIIAPDYEGLGVGGVHPYLHLESAAQSAIYAIKAAKEKLSTDLNGSWMSVGQSQGGQASLGIAQYAGGDFYYKGAVAAAPASSLGYIITQIAPTAIAQIEQLSPATATAIYSELLAYAAYAVTGISASESNFDYSKVFQSRALAIAKQAQNETDASYCLNGLIQKFGADIQSFLAEDTTRKVMDYPAFVANFDQNPSVAKFLQLSQPGTKAFSKPVYVVQGKDDTAVPYQVTQAMVKGLNDLGSSPAVQLDVVEGAGHSAAIVQKNEQVVGFIKTHMPPKL